MQPSSSPESRGASMLFGVILIALVGITAASFDALRAPNGVPLVKAQSQVAALNFADPVTYSGAAGADMPEGPMVQPSCTPGTQPSDLKCSAQYDYECDWPKTKEQCQQEGKTAGKPGGKGMQCSQSAPSGSGSVQITGTCECLLSCKATNPTGGGSGGGSGGEQPGGGSGGGAGGMPQLPKPPEGGGGGGSGGSPSGASNLQPGLEQDESAQLQKELEAERNALQQQLTNCQSDITRQTCTDEQYEGLLQRSTQIGDTLNSLNNTASLQSGEGSQNPTTPYVDPLVGKLTPGAATDWVNQDSSGSWTGDSKAQPGSLVMDSEGNVSEIYSTRGAFAPFYDAQTGSLDPAVVSQANSMSGGWVYGGGNSDTNMAVEESPGGVYGGGNSDENMAARDSGGAVYGGGNSDENMASTPDKVLRGEDDLLEDSRRVTTPDPAQSWYTGLSAEQKAALHTNYGEDIQAAYAAARATNPTMNDIREYNSDVIRESTLSNQKNGPFNNPDSPNNAARDANLADIKNRLYDMENKYPCLTDNTCTGASDSRWWNSLMRQDVAAQRDPALRAQDINPTFSQGPQQGTDVVPGGGDTPAPRPNTGASDIANSANAGIDDDRLKPRPVPASGDPGPAPTTKEPAPNAGCSSPECFDKTPLPRPRPTTETPPPQTGPTQPGGGGGQAGGGAGGGQPGGGGGSNPLSSFLQGLMKGLTQPQPQQPPQAPAQTCSTDPNIYQQQQQQYQQQLQQYNYQLQQYQYQMQLQQYQQQYYGGMQQIPPPQPMQPTPCSPSTQQQCTNQPPQPSAALCTGGYWQPSYQGTCVTNWQCISLPGATSTPPTASLSCQPELADVGQTLAISYSCSSGTASSSSFTIGNPTAGSASTTVKAPPQGANTATYSFTCTSGQYTRGAQCSVQINQSSIILVANPRTVQAASTTVIGWVTSGMRSCVISSPDQADFTSRNSANTSVAGSAESSPITKTSVFSLKCTTLAGQQKSVSTTVTLLGDTSTSTATTTSTTLAVGTYSAQGTNPDSSSYTGSVTITKKSGTTATYKLEWHIGSQVQNGEATLSGSTLAGNYADADGGDSGVVSYQLQSDGRLVGTWESDMGGGGTETLTPPGNH